MSNVNSKVVILAGGLGTRLREETDVKPKPMVDIGGKPILWHLMKIYAFYGLNEFIICTGYKGEVIREYFQNFHLNNRDFTIDLTGESPRLTYHQEHNEKWKVTVVNTGLDTPTGGRIHKIKDYIEEDFFYCTYGDGLANINISQLTDFHLNTNSFATMSIVKPLTRFGVVEKKQDGKVQSFSEKPASDGWINAGFFIFSKDFFNYLDAESTLEETPLRNLTKDHKLNAYEHLGFWQPMDTHREYQLLNKLWDENQAPWKLWVK